MSEVRFELQCETEVGDQVLVVGSHPDLGDWDLEASTVKLATSDSAYPLWTGGWAPTAVPGASPGGSAESAPIEFKFVVKRENQKGSRIGHAQWENSIGNRTLEKSGRWRDVQGVWMQDWEDYRGEFDREKADSKGSAKDQKDDESVAETRSTDPPALPDHGLPSGWSLGYASTGLAAPGSATDLSMVATDSLDSKLGSYCPEKSSHAPAEDTEQDTALQAAKRPARTAQSALKYGKTKGGSLVATFLGVASTPRAKVTAACAVGGAATLGAGGATAGLVAGGIIGAVLGVVPAFLTFGLSIPVGAALGSGAGLSIGTTVGSTAGLLGGVAAGYGGYGICARRWEQAAARGKEEARGKED